MNPELLKISNLFSYANCEIDFRKLYYSLIKGKTGSGKSAIFDIMCFALYGKTARRKYKSLLRDIPSKKRTGYVTYYFKVNDERYIIKRIIGRGKKLILVENGKRCKLRTQTMVQKRIVNIIGMDYDTFLNVCYFSQGDVGKVLSSDSGKRIDIVSKILMLNPLDGARKNVIKEFRNLESKFNISKGKLESYQEIISSIDFISLKKERRMIQSAINENVKKMTVVSQDYENTENKKLVIDELGRLKQLFKIRRDDWKDTIGDLNKEITNLKSRVDNRDELNEKIKKIESSLFKLKSDEVKLNKFVKRIERTNHSSKR
jgi:exonuclease SbcC